MHDALSGLCAAWLKHWDDYVAAGCWITCSVPDTSLPRNLSSLEVLFGYESQTTFDTLVPFMDDTKLSGGLDAFIIQCSKQMLRELGQVLEKRHGHNVAVRQKICAHTWRLPAGVSVISGDLVLVKETRSNIHRYKRGGELQDERWTGP